MFLIYKFFIIIIIIIIMSLPEVPHRDPKKIRLVENYEFGPCDLSRLTRPASLRRFQRSVDPISLEGPDGMLMPVGRRGKNGSIIGPILDLSTLPAWLDLRPANPLMPHNRQPVDVALREFYPIRWTDIGRGRRHPHPDYDPQNTVNFLHDLQNRYPLRDVGGVAAPHPLPEEEYVEPALTPPMNPPPLFHHGPIPRPDPNEMRVAALHRELLYLGESYHVFRRWMSFFTYQTRMPDWLLDYWTYHRWYIEMRSPPPLSPRFHIAAVADLQNHYRNRAIFRLRMAENLNIDSLTQEQREFHEFICEYWIEHPFDFRNDDNDTASAYFRNIEGCIRHYNFPDTFLARHRQNVEEYDRRGRVLPSPFPN